VKLDTCVWGGAVDPLKAAGHDVVWAGDWPTDPGDDEILALAHREGRILITLAVWQEKQLHGRGPGR
jgi:predicted nuclease of predicted toxin-antitoxin system